MREKRGNMSVVAGKRNVPDTPNNRGLDACWLAREVALHTMTVCSNERIFDPKFHTITERLMGLSIDIYLDVSEANFIWIDLNHPDADNIADRLKLQEHALRKCKNMLDMIGLARAQFHLRGKKVNYWSHKVVEAKRKIENWHNGDINRYQNLT